MLVWLVIPVSSSSSSYILPVCIQTDIFGFLASITTLEAPVMVNLGVVF